VAVDVGIMFTHVQLACTPPPHLPAAARASFWWQVIAHCTSSSLDSFNFNMCQSLFS
jgi:hypothetical protein